MKLLLAPRNYIPNFLKIRTKEAELVNLIPKPPQIRLLETVEMCKAKNIPIRIIILKARQMGFSTYVEALIFNDTATNKFKESLIVAHEDKASQNLYNMFKTFYDNLPEEFTPMKRISNAQELVFENPTSDVYEKKNNPGMQSKVSIASARNVNAGRSAVIHNLHASEVAFWQDAKTLMTSILQAVPDTPNTMVFIESTANGVGGWFYDFWKKAENGENDYIPLFFSWFDEPTYTRPFVSEEEKQQLIADINVKYEDKNGNILHTEEYDLMARFPQITLEQMNWRRHTIKNKCHGDIEMFHQEYPATPDEAFIASGRPRFNIGSLKKFRDKSKSGERGNLINVNGNIIFEKDDKGLLEVWEHPKKDMYYCIGADVAEGLVEGDYSVAQVGDTEFNQCARWRGHIDPDLFGIELVKLARYYNEAYLGIENNNHGLTTIKAVQREDYWNIYFSKIYDKISDKITQKVGWSTTSKSKPLMIDKLAEFIREAYIGLKDLTTINECLTYVIEDNGSTNAQTGCYDDCVMSLGIMLQMLLEGKGESFVPEAPSESKQKTLERAGFTLTKDEDIDEENRVEVAL